MSAGLIVLLVIVLLVIIVIGWYIATRNGFVRLNVGVDEAKAQISVQLQRRFDLIPNLVDTVKGYAAHEAGVLEKVTAARAATGNAIQSGSVADISAADKAMDGARLAINAVAEAYPDLKASANFLSLQEELTTTENKVSFARQAYNSAVMKFNTAIQVFPASIIAKGHYAPLEMFDVEDEAARKAPKVQF